jgi:hypothetical protein
MKRKKVPHEFVVCVKNRGYQASLELRKIYVMIPDEDAASTGHVRIIDESGEDYMYPSEWFIAIQLPKAVSKALLQAS